ncbi:MAG: SRPBCC domain-containing protein [Pseudomonadota bacterium]
MNTATHAEKGIYKVVINAPLDTVWSELVNTTSPRPFFWNSAWDTQAMADGNTYRMLSADQRTVGVVGRIVEIDPPNRLVTTFQLTNYDDPPSQVTYELTEVDGGTELRLITEQVVAGSKSEKSMADGSRFIAENFKAYIETGKVTFGARMMLGMMSLMGAFAPKSMRAEKWPHSAIQ